MASADTLRQRNVGAGLAGAVPQEKHEETLSGADSKGSLAEDEHPSGPVKFGPQMQALRMALFVLYFVGGCLLIFVAQVLVIPFYFIDRDYYYASMAITKQFFGIMIVTMTCWWCPTTVRISGDASVKGQIKQRQDGSLECSFPERIVLIANHQIYTDWIYLWWIAYTNRMHGHIYIILKESLKYIPLLGWGMQFYSFIFLSRKWAADKPRFQHRLQKLNACHGGPMSHHDPQSLDPMWLLIYPEGTNVSFNGRAASRKWADKQGLQDMRHVLLPRSTGLLFCLQELRNTVDYVYDCTVAYEGIPRGQYGQDIFTLFSTYFQGRRPKSVNMHFRRFRIADIPISETEKDSQAFELWLRERWREKDDMMEHYLQHGRFPSDPDGVLIESKEVSAAEVAAHLPGREIPAEQATYIETQVKPRNQVEVAQMTLPTLAVWLVGTNLFAALRWLGLKS